MAQITEVKVNYGKTINLGNYESARIDIELSAKILDGESSETAVEDLRAMAKLKIKQWEKTEREAKKIRAAEDYF